jgi:hypothetical protein
MLLLPERGRRPKGWLPNNSFTKWLKRAANSAKFSSLFVFGEQDWFLLYNSSSSAFEA